MNTIATPSPHWKSSSTQARTPARIATGLAAILCILGGLAGCAGTLPGSGGASPSSPSGPSAPATVTVTLQPATASVPLDQTQQFQVAVSGASNTSVTWEVNGVAGGNTTFGLISATGLYTAPPVLPNPASLTIVAVSAADAQASASASVTVMDDLAISVSPAAAAVPVGGAQVFAAILAGGSTASLSWSVNGIAGGNATVGTIAPNGSSNGVPTAVYTAPQIPPSPATVTIAATSMADSTKSGAATATITCASSSTLSPAALTVSLSQMQTFTASFCLPSGSPLAWDVNGVAGGNATVGTIASSGPFTAVYTAPADLPSPALVTIHAVPSATAAGAASAAATATISSSVAVTIAPPSATIPVGQEVSFAASVANTSDGAVTWAVNGIPNGNATLGQICVPGSNPCAPPSGPLAGAVGYVAPLSVPSNNLVTLTATSRADSSRIGSALVSISGPPPPVAISIAPQYAFVQPSGGALGTQQFAAHVTGGAGNTAITWSVQSAVPGQGCAGAACGSVDSSGLYTAPAVAPSPNAISVVATSQADPTKTASASASVAVTSGPTIKVILPSSVMAGPVEAFPLMVQGLNFVAGASGTGSVILIGGITQPTTCASATQCITSINPSAVQSPATLTVQVQNPGAPGALSNPVPFVIAPFTASSAIISLTSAQPAATGINFIVAEPTTAAASAPTNVDFIGPIVSGTCTVQASPIEVARPSSGAATVSICVHGNNLDPAFTYAFTGPTGGDIPIVASALTGIFPNLIELDLQISSTTLPGARSLFITTPNNDRAVATGLLEVR